jgi:uncharacterized membrane protein YfcA
MANAALFNALGVLLFMLLLVLGRPLADIAYFTIQMLVIDTVSAIEHRNKYAYIFSQEFGFYIGRFAGCGLFIALATYVSNDFALRYALLLLTLAWLCFLLLAVPSGTTAQEADVSKLKTFGMIGKEVRPLKGDRRYNEMLYFYDVVGSFGCLSEAEQKEFRDLMVAGAMHYIGDDPAKFPKLGRDNRSTDQAIVGVLTGLTFPDHPLANAWVEFGVRLFQDQLDHGVFDGAWNEVPRYHNWTVLLYSGVFQALKRRAGIDFFQHPNMKALAERFER